MSLSESREDVIWGHNFLIVILMLFLLGFMFIIGYVILDSLVTSFAASGHYSATAAQMGANYLSAQRVFDYVVIVLLAALILGLIVTSYKILTAPIYFVATLIMGGFYSLVGYIFSFMFKEIMSEAAFAVAVGFFPKTILLCTNLHWVGLISLISGSIALYAKRRKDEVMPLE